MSGLLDTISLYSFIRIYKPAKYMEIGSGNSTKFAYKAIRDGNLNYGLHQLTHILGLRLMKYVMEYTGNLLKN